MKRTLITVVIAGLLLAGCLKKATDQVPDEGIAAIATAVEDQLNAPVVSILGVLRDADERHQVVWSALSVGFDGRQIPVNWWLYRHGFVELVGDARSGGYVLSKKATDAVTANDPVWFEVEPGEPTRVDCTGPTALAAGGCEVDLPIVARLTTAGTAAGAVTPARFSVQATVALNEGGEWQVTALALTGTQPIHNIGLDAILGPEAARNSAAATVTSETEGRAMVLPSDSAPSLPPPIDGAPAIAPTAPPAPDYAGGRRVN